MPDSSNGFDAYTPADVAQRVEQVGVVKANLPLYRLGTLATLAGAFIALGAVYFLTVTTDWKGGYGTGQMAGGLVFSLGLVLVVVAGAELFTGNLLGAVSMAFMAYWAEHWAGAGGLVGARVLAVWLTAAARTARTRSSPSSSPSAPLWPRALSTPSPTCSLSRTPCWSGRSQPPLPWPTSRPAASWPWTGPDSGATWCPSPWATSWAAPCWWA